MSPSQVFWRTLAIAGFIVFMLWMCGFIGEVGPQ